MFAQIWQKLVRLGFHLLYNELAWTYDVVSWLVSLGEWRRWQRAALPFVAGRDVLELAHGPGHMLVELTERGHHAVGVDLSAAMGRIAHGRLHRYQHPTHLAQSYAQALPFDAATFDTVLSQFPTTYILDPATLQQVRRVLRPHGRLLILTEGHLTQTGVIHRFIAWLFYITGQTAPTHATPEEMWQPFLDALAGAGFTAEIQPITLEKSAATLIIANK